jgi:hypothetical protein
MHIERTNGRTNGLGGPGAADGGQPLPRAGSKAAGVQKPADDAGVQAPEGTDFVQMAKKAADVNVDAVAEAKRLLESGELSSPEAIRRAAESMLRLGI